MAATSCEEGPSVPPIQNNPQGPVYKTEDVSVTISNQFAGGIVNLNDFIQADAMIPAMTVTSNDTTLNVGHFIFDFEMSNSQEFKEFKNIAMVQTGDNEWSLNPVDVNDAHVALFGKSPKEKTVYYRILAYIIDKGGEFRFGGTDYYLYESDYKEICLDAGFVIESAYYFLSNATTWELENPVDAKMSHSSLDVYDDPYFSIVVDADEECYWKIAPQSAVDAGNWDLVLGPEVNGDTSLEGVLLVGGQAGKLPEAGKFKITVNMETMHYEIVEMIRPEYLCTPGGYNSWNQNASSWLNYYDYKGYFCGAVLESDGFKLTDGNSWADNKTWGLGDAEGTLVQPGANIPVPAPGLYWLVANLDDLTYSNVEVFSVGVVGGLNGWAADAPIELTPNADDSVWSADVDLTGDWKIILNHSWDSNYGGSVDNLVFDAGNISVADGTYNVAVSFAGNYPTLTLTAK